MTNKPTDTLSSRVTAIYGTDDTRALEAGIGGPVANNVSARLAGVYRHRDGQFDNVFTGKKAGKYNIWDVRGQVLWDITSGTSLLVKAHAGRTAQDQPYQHVGLLPGGADSDGFVQPSGRDDLSNNGRIDSHVRRVGADAHLTVDLGGPTLTDILAFNRSKGAFYSDDDANPISNYHTLGGSRSRTISNELRIASPDADRFGWIVGGYYFDNHIRNTGSLGLYGLTNFGTRSAGFDDLLKTQNVGAFVSLSYEITPELKATAGGRYTWERKSIAGTAFEYLPDPANVLDSLGTTFTYIDTAQDICFDSNMAPMAAPPLKRSWSKPTWDVSLDWKASDTIFVFGRIARGFRSGNYNAYLSSPEQLSSYNPETLTSYEAGIKTQWFDNRLTFNVTGFHYDYKDMQVSVLQTVGTVTANAGAARVNGLEIEASAKPFPGLSLDAGYGFQDSKYTDFTDASVPAPINQGQTLDLTGQSLERAPRNTLNLSGSYEIAVGAGKLSLSTNWRYTSRIRFQAWSDATKFNPAPFLASPASRALLRDAFSQDAYWTGDARLAYRFESNGLELAAWVKNITNERYDTSAFGMFFNRSISTYPGERRTAGVSVSLEM